MTCHNPLLQKDFWGFYFAVRSLDNCVYPDLFVGLTLGDGQAI